MESGAAAAAGARGKALHGSLPKRAATIRVGFLTSIRTMRLPAQGKLPAQGILICGKLTLKLIIKQPITEGISRSLSRNEGRNQEGMILSGLVSLACYQPTFLLVILLNIYAFI